MGGRSPCIHLGCSCFPSWPLCSQVLQLRASRRGACVPMRAFPASTAPKQEDCSTLEQLHVRVHWAGCCAADPERVTLSHMWPVHKTPHFHGDSYLSMAKGSKTSLTHCRNLSYSTHQHVRFFAAVSPVPLQPWHGWREGSRAAPLVRRSGWTQNRAKKKFPFPGKEFAALGGLGAPLMARLNGVLPCWAARCLVLT